jgi:lipid II:glycine glycyltransferase (peptidoglycan interpeptide bridge formation enzyme)
MTSGLTAAEWEAFLDAHPDAHLLQMSAWGELKSEFGWETVRLRHGRAGAQLLFRRLAPGMTLGYVARGPVGEWLPDLLPALDDACRQRRAFALKVEPDQPDEPASNAALARAGLLPSPHTVQPRRTLLVDITGDDGALLARMHQKTRYNIGLAGRRGVTVEPWADVESFAVMMRATGARDRFGVHSAAYYRRAYDLFHIAGACELLAARVEGEPVAALMVFARGRRAWYLYGASSERHRQRMPNYLLQWEAMRWARSRGCAEYDLWGVPDEEPAELERGFPGRSDGLWGVYRFKRGFGGRPVRSAGAWDRPYRRWQYAAYRWLIARRLGG